MSNLLINSNTVADTSPKSEEGRVSGSSVIEIASDGALLRFFLEKRDEAAFAELVARFGPMVYGVAMRILHHQHAAEDAFQATFMILARDAKKIRSPDSIGAWLHGTAIRVAKTALKRRLREETLKEPTEIVDNSLLFDINKKFNEQLLDEELLRLPEVYRASLVLHFLEGKTCKETAFALGISVGAVRGRLQRGKRELRLRLLRRGVELSVVVASMSLWQSVAQASIHTSLSTSTTAGGMATLQGTPYPWVCSPEAVKILTQDIVMLTKGKILTTSVLLFSTITVGLFSSGPAISQEKIDHPKSHLEVVAGEIDTEVADQVTEEEAKSKLTELNTSDEKEAKEAVEKPDGIIVRVDPVTRRVWIDLGSEDRLRPKISFSVYPQKQIDLGKNKKDIKAKIEVTKIINNHLAEARVIQEDFDRPIQEGDLVDSPIFTPGQIEFFSFIGTFDFDRDGQSDREILHDVLANAGAEIELEVSDQGNRIPEKGVMTQKSKFLVIGEIPIPNAKFPVRAAEVLKIIDESNALRKEALKKGIRVVTLKDFLNYIGYIRKPQIIEINGVKRAYNLKSGQRAKSAP